MPKFPWATTAFILWMAFVTWACLASFREDGLPGMDIPHLDKLAHCTFYTVAAFLGVLAIRELKGGGWTLAKALWISFFFCVGFGTIIEVLQWKLTADRMGDYRDALANTVGALIGTRAIGLLFTKRGDPNWK